VKLRLRVLKGQGQSNGRKGSDGRRIFTIHNPEGPRKTEGSWKSPNKMSLANTKIGITSQAKKRRGKRCFAKKRNFVEGGGGERFTKAQREKRQSCEKRTLQKAVLKGVVRRNRKSGGDKDAYKGLGIGKGKESGIGDRDGAALRKKKEIEASKRVRKKRENYRGSGKGHMNTSKILRERGGVWSREECF